MAQIRPFRAVRPAEGYEARIAALPYDVYDQGEARRAAGDCFLDRDFAQKLPRALSPRRCCRTEEGWEFYLPQCALAPAVEGVVTLSLSEGSAGTPV